MIFEIFTILKIILIFISLIIIYFISRENIDEKKIFKIFGLALIFLIGEIFYNAFTYLPSGILFLISYLWIFLRTGKFIKRYFLFFSTAILLILIFLSLKYIFIPLVNKYEFSILKKIIISTSLFLDSLIIFIILLKSLIYYGGEYLIPWVLMLIGFVFKFIGDYMVYYFLVNFNVEAYSFDNLWIFWLFFLNLGLYKYLRIQIN